MDSSFEFQYLLNENGPVELASFPLLYEQTLTSTIAF